MKFVENELETWAEQDSLEDDFFDNIRAVTSFLVHLESESRCTPGEIIAQVPSIHRLL